MARGPRQKQMGVALPDALRGQLEEASAKAGRSIAEEIRQRLERTFEEDARDPVLREFVSDIIGLSIYLKGDTGSAWHEHPAAHAAFRSGVLALLEQYKPEGAPVFSPAVSSGLNIANSDDPETVGRALVRYLRRFKRQLGRMREIPPKEEGEEQS
jgi:hypothetical protein